MSSPRGRGRPRGGTDSRARILAAATEEFGEHGYDRATIRAIAARAGVDPALVHHYFGAKADLFAESIGVPLRPDLDVPRILEGPREEVGERIVRYVLGRLEQPDVRRRTVTVLRAALGAGPMAQPLIGFLSRELIAKVAGATGAEDGPLRANLVASQVVGMVIARYVVRLEPLASASVDEVAALIGPTLQRYLYG
ncbi:TetR/AcrR family transcriptional regulator [Brachybacterium hainanense]|uniref:TetR family transcriptional regulator n=1 Tax=Brachybacterium hainanense TaxID=1541174 RepID=A0ABV6R6P2_9MICO